MMHSSALAGKRWFRFDGLVLVVSLGVLVFACDSEVTEAPSGSGAGAAGQGGSGATDSTGGTTSDGGDGGDGATQSTGVGGTTSDVCAPNDEDGNCRACLKEECCDELEACDADSSCQCITECLPTAPGMGPMAKYQYCVDECGDPGRLWGAIRECRNTDCSDVCMGGGPGPGAGGGPPGAGGGSPGAGGAVGTGGTGGTGGT